MTSATWARTSGTQVSATKRKSVARASLRGRRGIVRTARRHPTQGPVRARPQQATGAPARP
eukprot:3436222-Lingulodinium_polyedra.AAC.1